MRQSWNSPIKLFLLFLCKSCFSESKNITYLIGNSICPYEIVSFEYALYQWWINTLKFWYCLIIMKLKKWRLSVSNFFWFFTCYLLLLLFCCFNLLIEKDSISRGIQNNRLTNLRKRMFSNCLKLHILVTSCSYQQISMNLVA